MEHWPTQLYTVGEYAALGETEFRTELQEGHLLMSPSPKRRHVLGIRALARQIEDQLPGGFEWEVLTEIDLDLGLVPPDQPGTVRQPDLMVGDGLAFERAEDNGETMKAADVLLVVEFVSPGSRRMDYKIKRSEYADAGIRHYWIVDVKEPISLRMCELTETSGYVDKGEVIGGFTTAEPFPMTIDLASLVRRRAEG
ncbi:Uma2 family endonuclease [Kibdelosporangium banguiense]|nr:Uma2 family endonuclease [Kibdelosporangium banguiense]